MEVCMCFFSLFLLSQVNMFLKFELICSFWRASIVQCSRYFPSVVIVCHALELGMHLYSVMWRELKNGLYLGSLEATDQQEKEAGFPRSLSVPTERHVETRALCWLHTVGLCSLPLSCSPFLWSGTKATFPVRVTDRHLVCYVVYRSCLGKAAAQNLWALTVQEWLEAPPSGEWNHWSHGKLFGWSLFLWEKQEDPGHRGLLVQATQSELPGSFFRWSWLL